MADQMKSLSELDSAFNPAAKDARILVIEQAYVGLITASELITKLETMLDCKFKTEVS